MTVHVAATMGCNMGCDYCYENPARENSEEWVDREYDIDAIIERLEEWKERYPNEIPGLHGGEPLLIRDDDIERIYAWIDEHFDGRSHIQTNGTMLTERHIDIFAEYDVHVGISCDGPGELNKHRIAYEGGDDVTRRMTAKTHRSIERLRERDVSVGIITVLHTGNAGTDDQLECLLAWMDDLAEMGVSGHYNPAIPYEDVQTDISLDPERLKEVYLRTWEWLKAEPYRSWNPMRDYVDNLLGATLGNCTKKKCDVYNAGAAKIVTGDGETTGCGKTFSGVGDGGVFLQGPSTGNEYNDTEERYEMLKALPGPYTTDDRDEGEKAPDMGGCKGCQYWNVCTGGCPSAGMNDDYRNRTVWCPAIYALYEQIERDLRAILPNITLITDYPWNANLSDAAASWNLDIQPFVAMDPGISGKSSSYGASEHDAGAPRDRLPDEAMPEQTFEEQVSYYEAKYGEEIVTAHKETGMIHADSDRPNAAPVRSDKDVASGESDAERSDWRPVEAGGDADGASDTGGDT